jgi:hypothetical protein
VLDQQRPVEGLRMVVILLAARVEGEVGLVAVVIVLHHHRDGIGAEGSQHLLGNRRLAAATSAGDTNDKRGGGNLVHPRMIPERRGD